MNHFQQQLNKIIIEDMQKNVDKVLSGEINTIDLYYVRPNDVISYLETIQEQNYLDDMEQNGWSFDFWITFWMDGKEDKKFVLSGDGIYYNHLTLYSENEE